MNICHVAGKHNLAAIYASFHHHLESYTATQLSPGCQGKQRVNRVKYTVQGHAAGRGLGGARPWIAQLIFSPTPCSPPLTTTGFWRHCTKTAPRLQAATLPVYWPGLPAPPLASRRRAVGAADVTHSAQRITCSFACVFTVQF